MGRPRSTHFANVQKLLPTTGRVEHARPLQRASSRNRLRTQALGSALTTSKSAHSIDVVRKDLECVNKHVLARFVEMPRICCQLFWPSEASPGPCVRKASLALFWEPSMILRNP